MGGADFISTATNMILRLNAHYMDGYVNKQFTGKWGIKF